jgi:hypothetical protein
MCDPLGLKFVAGDLATCKANVDAACAAAAASPIPGYNGVVDPAACKTALTSSCDSYFETSAHSGPACYPKPGSIADGMVGCGFDVQCVAGDYCDLSSATFMDPRCFKGKCAGLVPSGSPCDPAAPTPDCDVRAGFRCVPTANGMPIMSDNNPICQVLTFGDAAAPCLLGTNKECKEAFYCGPNHTCVPKLGAGSSCGAAANNAECDNRISLECVIPMGGTTPACTPIVVVPSGSQCGLVNGQVHHCQGDLYCDTTGLPPHTCKPRVALGNGCVTSIANECMPGLVCSAMTGTCSPPLAAVCM